MNITKKRVETSATRFIREFEERAISRIERVSLLDDFDFTYEMNQLNSDYYLYWGSLIGIRSLLDYSSAEYRMICEYCELIRTKSDQYTDKLLSVWKATFHRINEEPVFAPTTTATEIVLIASDVSNQDGEKSPSCSVESELIGVPVVECHVCSGSGLLATGSVECDDDYEKCSHCNGIGFEPDQWEEAA